MPIAVLAFLAATAGSDIFARMTIGDETLQQAVREHLYWAVLQAVGTILLIGPFVGVAFICAVFQKHVQTRSIFPIFTAAMAALLIFYFNGYQGAQHAMLQQKWTAATLSVGLLPFFPGIAVVLLVLGAGVLAAKFDSRKPK